MKRLMNIFHNPDRPTIDDYFEPWNYDYETLTNSPRRKHQPVARRNQQLQANLSTKLNGVQTGKMT